MPTQCKGSTHCARPNTVSSFLSLFVSSNLYALSKASFSVVRFMSWADSFEKKSSTLMATTLYACIQTNDSCKRKPHIVPGDTLCGLHPLENDSVASIKVRDLFPIHQTLRRSWMALPKTVGVDSKIVKDNHKSQISWLNFQTTQRRCYVFSIRQCS